MFRTAAATSEKEIEKGKQQQSEEKTNNAAAEQTQKRPQQQQQQQPPSSPRQNYNLTLQDQENNISLGHVLMKEGVIANTLADDDIFVQVRKKFAEKSSFSAHLIFELERCCKAKANKKELSFNKSELSELLTQSLNTGLTSSEIDTLFKASKAPNQVNEGVYVNEFFMAVKGGMNKLRRQILDHTFSCLDRDNAGSVNAEVVYRCYDASRHPDVRNKKKSDIDVKDEFLKNFDVMESRDMKIYRHDFMSYYSKISSCVLSDNDFEDLLKDTWNFSTLRSGSSSGRGRFGESSMNDGSTFDRNNDISLAKYDEIVIGYGRVNNYDGYRYRSESKQYQNNRLGERDQREFGRYAESKSSSYDHRDQHNPRIDRLCYDRDGNNQVNARRDPQNRPSDRPSGGAASRKLEMEGPLPMRKEDSATSPRAASSPRSFANDIRIPHVQQSTSSPRETRSPRSGSGSSPPRHRTPPPPYTVADRMDDTGRDRGRDISPRRSMNGNRDREFRSYDDDRDMNYSGGPYDSLKYGNRDRFGGTEFGAYRSNFPPDRSNFGGNGTGNYYTRGDSLEDYYRNGDSRDDGYMVESENIRRFSETNNNMLPQNGGMRYGNPETMMMMSRIHNTGPVPHSRYNADASRTGFSSRNDNSMMSPRGMSSSPRRYY